MQHASPFQKLGSLLPFHRDAHHAARHLDKLFHVANRSYLKNPVNIRDHLIRLLLRRQKYSLIAHHRLLHRRDGFIPDDIEIYRHLRQHGQSAQRDHRHCQFLIFHNTFIFLNQMYRYFL